MRIEGAPGRRRWDQREKGGDSWSQVQETPEDRRKDPEKGGYRPGISAFSRTRSGLMSILGKREHIISHLPRGRTKDVAGEKEVR